MSEERKKRETPLLDELEKGPWPSFVKEIKRTDDTPVVQDLLGQLERSYEEKIGHWKHGGHRRRHGVRRRRDRPLLRPRRRVPERRRTSTRCASTSRPGWFYTSDVLRTICDIWEKHGSGLTNMHGSTGDIILLGDDDARSSSRSSGD